MGIICEKGPLETISLKERPPLKYFEKLKKALHQNDERPSKDV